jgi:hypothetical protein
MSGIESPERENFDDCKAGVSSASKNVSPRRHGDTDENPRIILQLFFVFSVSLCLRGEYLV